MLQLCNVKCQINICRSFIFILSKYCIACCEHTSFVDKYIQIKTNLLKSNQPKPTTTTSPHKHTSQIKRDNNKTANQGLTTL